MTRTHSERLEVSEMHRVIAVALVLALSVPLGSATAAAAAQTTAAGSIAGAAKNAAGQVIARGTVRLRNVGTGQLAATGVSDVSGQFAFAAVQPGTYVVEVVDASGAIIGTSASIPVAAGAAVTGISVSASAAAAAATGGSFFASTIGLVTLAASGAAVAAVTVGVTRTTASSSR